MARLYKVSEITRYLREDVLDGEEDPLIWWKVNEQRLPVMAKLASTCAHAPAAPPQSELLVPQVTSSLPRVRSYSQKKPCLI